MINGFYKASFSTPLGAGAGVVSIEGNKISGGDSSMYYHGTVQLDGSKVTAQFSVNSHTPGMQSVLGNSATTVTLTGETDGKSAVLKGSSREGVKLQAELTRLID